LSLMHFDSRFVGARFNHVVLSFRVGVAPLLASSIG